MSQPKRIFIAATLQNEGKTTFSLGLIAALTKRFKRIGFIKPIGQRYLMEQGFKVDEDSVLIDKIFNVSREHNIKDLSPIAVEKGFTEKYIEGKAGGNYAKDIKDSFDKVAEDSDFVIIEGTGHAGVGSVFDLSNATVARLLNAEVVLLTPGGIGRPIDEAMLNKSLFDTERVKLAGVVVNKVLPGKFAKINKYVRMGFEKKKTPVLGVMPYQKRLALPTVREILEELKIELLCGKDYLDSPVDKILVGAMEASEALKYVEENSLLITAFDKIDIINAIIDLQTKSKRKESSISGLVLSGGRKPSNLVLKRLEDAKIPTLLSGKDTYSVAAKIHGIKVKIKPEDRIKVDIIIKMVERYVDIDRIIECANA
ncbi:MAG: AAA family ATPase [Candidatus Omnitrophica bacterium]|nr:AAA family ATPase [Candidatus Omnitrophota bacterium]